MNNKGYAMTGILYTTLIVFVLLMVSLLMNLQNRKNILQELKTEAVNAINKNTEIEYYKGQLSACQNELSTSGSANKQELVKSLQYSGLGITEESSWEEIYEILADAYPALAIGTTYDFAYTGGIQTWTAEASGLYKLEVWGAQGGYYSSSYIGGLGGYSIGYIQLTKGDTLYVVVGGAGTYATSGTIKGGYNGGGDGLGGSYYNSSGGGATHISTISATLSALSSYKSSILLVAGGGGGAIYSSYAAFQIAGGAGGGTNGGNIYNINYEANVSGGTQSSGNAFGQGGSMSSKWGCGSGGGYYGGVAREYGAGTGGSGYIGGVPSLTYNGIKYIPSTTSGQNSGNGKAVITYIAN